MKMKWFKTKFTGVRYREHPTKKNGVSEKDRYFTLHYKLKGKVHDEPVGWASDGWNAEKAALELAKLKENRTKGGPVTLIDKRETEKDNREAVEAERQAKVKATKTLQQYWDETYFPQLKKSKKKKKCSWEKEEQHFRIWIAPIMGYVPLKDIGYHEWDQLKESLADKDKSERTQLYVTGTLRIILKHAFKRKLAKELPPSGKDIGVTSPGNNRRTRVIGYDEQDIIMKELDCRDRHTWRLTRFAFLTGCRASEAFNLVWANVDFAQDCIVFPKTKNDDPKTLPLTPPLKELFSTMEKGKADELVFPRRDGTRYPQPPPVFKTVVNALELNEGRPVLDHITFHSIKHTVATRLGDQLSVRDLMDTIGWRTAQMAMRYVHENKDRKAKALASLGSAPQTGKVLQFQAKA